MRTLRQQLKLTFDDDGTTTPRPKGIHRIEDDEILGNSDKMLFYSKELEASAEDVEAAHNPFIVSKLDLQSINSFDFDKFQGYIDTTANLEDGDKDEAEAARKLKVN